jgi:hypothetical protein
MKQRLVILKLMLRMFVIKTTITKLEHNYVDIECHGIHQDIRSESRVSYCYTLRCFGMEQTNKVNLKGTIIFLKYCFFLK